VEQFTIPGQLLRLHKHAMMTIAPSVSWRRRKPGLWGQPGGSLAPSMGAWLFNESAGPTVHNLVSSIGNGTLGSNFGWGNGNFSGSSVITATSGTCINCGTGVGFIQIIRDSVDQEDGNRNFTVCNF
jgi:hypothetical protein